MTALATTTRLRPEARVTGTAPAYAFKGPGVGEPFPVVADLGKDTGSGRHRQPGEAGDDLCIGVGEERFLGGRCEVVDAPAGGVELLEERLSLPAHGLLDHRQLVQAVPAEDLPEPFDLGIDPAAESSGTVE